MEASKRPCYRSCQTKAPFSPELREFIANSRKDQTLYLNCEGAYPRRVVKKGEEDWLSDYIYNTLYGAQGRKTETDSQKIKHVEKMKKLMLESSKRYYSNGEVHFTVVWVYYFQYSLKEGKALPVFKMYKSKDKNDAIFLDIYLKFYGSWNCYIESADFPESFLCVPRHGEYHFDREENKLDLEFLNSGRIYPLVGHRRQSAIPKKSFSPFSCRAVRPWIIKIKELNESLKQKIRSLMALLDNFWREYNIPITCAGVFSFIVAVHVFAPGMVCEPLSQLALMFLSSRLEGEVNSLVASASCSNVPHSLPQKSPSEKTELRQKEKNWIIILQDMCSFLTKNHAVVDLTLKSVPVPPQAVKVANGIFYVANSYDILKLLNQYNNLTVGKASTSGSLVQSLEANHASLNQNPLKLNSDKNLEPGVNEDSVSFEKASNSGCLEKRENFASLDQKPGSGGDVGIVEEMSVEKLLPVFDCLETDCASEIQKKALECYRKTPLPESLTNCINLYGGYPTSANSPLSS